MASSITNIVSIGYSQVAPPTNIRGEQNSQHSVLKHMTEQNIQKAQQSSKSAVSNKDRTMQRNDNRAEGTYSHEDQSEKEKGEKPKIDITV